MAEGADTYRFRWARGVGMALLVAAVCMSFGILGMLWGVLQDSESWWLLIFGALPLFAAAAFVAAFARYLQTACVAIDPGGVRVSYRPSFDGTIPFASIECVELVTHHVIYGIGIRTNLAGHVAFASAWGPAAELTLRSPIRVGILPYIWSTRAEQLRLTVERPEEFVANVTGKLAQQGDDA